jgi:hypothetical protein
MLLSLCVGAFFERVSWLFIDLIFALLAFHFCHIYPSQAVFLSFDDSMMQIPNVLPDQHLS